MDPHNKKKPPLSFLGNIVNLIVGHFCFQMGKCGMVVLGNTVDLIVGHFSFQMGKCGMVGPIVFSDCLDKFAT